jgi:hypothetical protein
MVMSEILFNAKVFNLSQTRFKEVYSRKEILERFLFSPERLGHFGDERVVSTLSYIIIRCLDEDPNQRPRLDWIAVSLKLILGAFAS